MRWAAAVIFIIAACTDKLDGWMARKYNQVTELGKLMDPIADKLLDGLYDVFNPARYDLLIYRAGNAEERLFLRMRISATASRLAVNLMR